MFTGKVLYHTSPVQTEMRYKVVMIFLIILVAASVYQAPAFAHRSGCHRWHSCPSDTGSYTCGDTGYCSECPDNNYCKAGQPISFSNYSSNPGASNSATTSTSTPAPPIPTMPSKAPSWVKTVFNLQSQGKISDDELIRAIQFLAKQGIVKLD